MSLQDIPPKRRWPRSQKFALTEKGREAEVAYREEIRASRDQAGRGRDSFDAARAAWAERFAIQPDDGLYLCEAAGDPKNLQELTDALEACGKSRSDALAALSRLVDQGLFSVEAT